jgi:hypothetical protein
MPVLPGAEAGLVPLFGISVYWFHLPVLIVVISLVYGATRYDDWGHILREARRWVVRLGVFLVAIVVLLYLLASWV